MAALAQPEIVTIAEATAKYPQRSETSILEPTDGWLKF